MTTWFAGDELGAADLENELNARPRYNGSFGTPTITTGTNTNLTPTDLVKVGGISVSGSTITVDQDGEYELGIYLRFASQTTGAGYRVARLNVNGSDRGWFNNTAVGINGSNTYAGGAQRLMLLASDQIVFQGFHTAGASLALVAGSHCWVDRVVQ